MIAGMLFVCPGARDTSHLGSAIAFEGPLVGWTYTPSLLKQVALLSPPEFQLYLCKDDDPLCRQSSQCVVSLTHRVQIPKPRMCSVSEMHAHVTLAKDNCRIWKSCAAGCALHLP